ncbi:MAG: murein L,D-transpeptidase catalytic domain family protein [Fusobacteriaceae bacterium]
MLKIKGILILFFSIFILNSAIYSKDLENLEKNNLKLNELSSMEKLYKDLNLEKEIKFDVFKIALKGYSKIDNKKKKLLTIIDFSKPSSEKRFYVIDLKKKKTLIKSYVAHGTKSGENIATSFSNQINSKKSSLGFFLTENTYNGKNGYSMKLNGLEAGINDKAKARAIVIHGANYVSASIVNAQGRLGRSFGCPALPKKINKEVIDTIKNGSVIYIYGNDNNYLKKSEFV